MANRLSVECLAVADALRTVRTALQKTIHHNPPELAQLFPEISIISIAGLDVARALEALAERLAVPPPIPADGPEQPAVPLSPAPALAGLRPVSQRLRRRHE